MIGFGYICLHMIHIVSNLRGSPTPITRGEESLGQMGAKNSLIRCYEKSAYS